MGKERKEWLSGQREALTLKSDAQIPFLPQVEDPLVFALELCSEAKTMES